VAGTERRATATSSVSVTKSRPSGWRLGKARRRSVETVGDERFQQRRLVLEMPAGAPVTHAHLASQLPSDRPSTPDTLRALSAGVSECRAEESP